MNWWTIPREQTGLSKRALCTQWLDQTMPAGRANPGLNRGVVSGQLPTCTNALFPQQWILHAIGEALGRTQDLEAVADDLNAALLTANKAPITQPNVIAVTAMVIKGYAGPLTETICRIGQHALDQVRTWVAEQDSALPKSERDKLKDSAARLVRQQLDRDGALADHSRLMALRPGSVEWIRLVEEVFDRLREQLVTPQPPSGEATSLSPPGFSQTKAKPKRVSQDEKGALVRSEEGQRWKEEVGRAIEQVRERGFVRREPEDVQQEAIAATLEEATLHLLKPGTQGDPATLPGLVARIMGHRISDAKSNLYEIGDQEESWGDREPGSAQQEQLGIAQEDPAELAAAKHALEVAAARLPQDGSWEADSARELLLELDASTVDEDIRTIWQEQLTERWKAAGPRGPGNAHARSRAAAIDCTLSMIPGALADALGRGGSA